MPKGKQTNTTNKSKSSIFDTVHSWCYRNIMYTYLGSEEYTKVINHENRMETLRWYMDRLNGVAPKPAASMKLKIMFKSFHPNHVMMNCKLTRNKFNAATRLEDITEFMQIQKHFQTCKWLESRKENQKTMKIMTLRTTITKRRTVAVATSYRAEVDAAAMVNHTRKRSTIIKATNYARIMGSFIPMKRNPKGIRFPWLLDETRGGQTSPQ